MLHILLALLPLSVPHSNIQKDPLASHLDEIQTGVGRLITLGHRCNVFLVEFNQKKGGEKGYALTSQHCLTTSPIQGVWTLPSRENIWVDLQLEKKGSGELGDDWALLSYSSNKLNTLYQPRLNERQDEIDHSAKLEYAVSHSYYKKCSFDKQLLTSNAEVIRFKGCDVKEGDSGSPYYHYSPNTQRFTLSGIVISRHKQKTGVGYYLSLNNIFKQ